MPKSENERNIMTEGLYTFICHSWQHKTKKKQQEEKNNEAKKEGAILQLINVKKTSKKFNMVCKSRDDTRKTAKSNL